MLALVTLLSKFKTNYWNHDLLAIYYGISYGFCGNLTTISTFVNELNNLPTKWSYIYGMISNAVAQIGIILILNIYQGSLVKDRYIMPPPINLC